VSRHASADDPQRGRFEIRLLEAPVDRRDDPRAHTYIVDHLAPGTVIRRRVELNNTSDRPLHTEIYPAAAEIHGGTFGFASGRTANELSSWMSVDRPSLDLPPRGKAQVRAMIDVPRRVQAGERYAVLWAQVVAQADGSHNVAVVHRVGIRVYLDVGPGGEPPSDFRIEAMTPERADDGRPVVAARVHNTGRRAIDMNGTLTLSDGPGSLRAGPFQATPGTTLAPGDTGPVTITLDRLIPAGPWKAHLTLNSGRVRRSATATITFPAHGAGRAVKADPGPDVPLLPMALVTLGLLALLLAVLAVRQRRRRKGTAQTEPDVLDLR
jgi:hypothetical protein